jgi:hypothetical protein
LNQAFVNTLFPPGNLPRLQRKGVGVRSVSGPRFGFPYAERE